MQIQYVDGPLTFHLIRRLQSNPKNVPVKPRNTDPNNPRYVLATDDPVAAAGQRPFSAVPACARVQMRELLQPPTDGPAVSPTQQAPPPQQPLPRDPISVADIAGTSSKTATRAEPISNFKLDASDIEGSWPGWKPSFRCERHGGRTPT